ncbi:hypothetical protein ABPG75_001894 [Micractinium tetrahymenae]
MAALRPRGAGAPSRGPGKAMVGMVALICLAAGYFLGNSSRWAEASTQVLGEGVAAELEPQRAQQELGTAAGAGDDDFSSGGGGSASSTTAAVGGAGGGARVKTVCEDTCPGHAKNGVCNEGRPTPDKDESDSLTIFEVLCDLGTDCSDCGPWVHNNTDASDSWRPIQEIRDKQFDVFTRQARHPGGFYMAFTDPVKDVDVSSAIHHNALLEVGFTWAWHLNLKEGCRKDGKQALVLDVGANFGYYSLLSASMGCRVVAWEPVPYFAAYFKYALLRNNMTHAVQMRFAIVSNSTGGELTIVVPNRGIWGTAGIGGKNIDGAIKNEGGYDNVVRPVERVDSVVHEDVLIMKIDVEGFEPSVLHGSRNLLLKHSVENIFMEYSPGVAERSADYVWFESNPAALMGLLRGGYTILHLGDMKDSWPDWEGKSPLPKLEEVTEAVLRNDIEDAWRLQSRTLGCHQAAAELGEDAGKMFNCLSIPEGIHPQSFRSVFGHNTNIWAFKKKPWFASIGGTASLAPVDSDIQHEFFIPGGIVGAARRLCVHLPPEVAVMHRCPCVTKEVCGRLEEKVKRLAQEGQLPPFPISDRKVEPQGIESW